MIFTIAVDGPAAAGKGTLSKALAEALGFAHLDTGSLYRATALRVLQGEAPLLAAQNLTPEDLASQSLRTPEVGEAASKVAALPEVREALLQFQRDFARRIGGAVLDGRDVGTVIAPEAEVKLFVTASAEARAERRFLEYQAKGLDTSLEAVLDEVLARDARDASRDAAPMVAAADAIVIDTSAMSTAEVYAAAMAVIAPRLK